MGEVSVHCVTMEVRTQGGYRRKYGEVGASEGDEGSVYDGNVAKGVKGNTQIIFSFKSPIFHV